MKQTNEIKVSVCVVTYNQEKYLAECLESLVQQETDFNFEIIVGEDCSTDGTRAIVQKYAEQYPHLIVPMLYAKNVGALENIKQVYLKASGKYIAHVDGDDVALPNKLQKQYNIMEKGYAICSHNVCSISLNNNINEDFWNYQEGEYDWKFYLRDMPFFAHSSKMFVKNHLKDWLDTSLPDTYDFEIHLESLKYGNIFHLSDNLGCYRLNTGLMINDKDILIKMIDTKIRVYEKSIYYFNDKKFIKAIVLKSLFRFFVLCVKKGNYSKIFNIFGKVIKVMRIK